MKHASSLLALLLLGACADRGTPSSAATPHASSAVSASAEAPRGARAPFVVAFVVDQLSAWVAEERLPLLPESGGFARLRREGTWLKTVRLPYAVTDTAPGHASLHTGKTPNESGIWGNEVPEGGERFTFLRDPSTRLVTPDGVRNEPGSSCARLRVETVADRLRVAHPDALTVSISLKDRGAIVPAGHKPSFALWFEKSIGSFVTSTAFATGFPKWAASIADASAVERAREPPWTLSDRGWIERNVKTKDDAPGEGDLDGFGTTFPHLAKTSAAFRLSPASDVMILDLALAAVSAEHGPGRPTLLLLSMSASDITGHTFGPDSWEAWDYLYKLDASLGRFLDELERRVGPVSVILSADHGNSSMPEVVRARRPAACDGPNPPAPDRFERSPCVVGSRIEATELGHEIIAEAGKALGPGDWVAGVADPYVFLTPNGRSLDPTRRATLDAAIRRVFEHRKDTIAELFDVRTLTQVCPPTLAKARGVPDRARPGEDLTTLVCRSWSPDTGAGDYYMVPKLGFFFDSEIVTGKGASHGGPYLHDRTIPVLVRGRGADPHAVIDDPVDFTVYSEVLASLVGLDGRSPREIIEKLRASR